MSSASLPTADPAGPAAAPFELRHCSSKGRYLVASRAIEAGVTLWQEQPVIVCSSIDAAVAPSVQADSPEECAFAAVLPALPSQLCAPDVLLTLHAMRRLRLFGRQSRVWTLMQQLQSKPDAAAASDASASSAPSRFQQRFKVLAVAARQIFEALQQQLAASPPPPPLPLSSSDSADFAANAVVVDAQAIEQFLGMLQLNAHRTARLPAQDPSAASTAAASDSAAAASPAAFSVSPPGSSGKALSLRLSMLEHDCSPNLDFASEWVDSSSAAHLSPGATALDATTVDEADERLVSTGVHGSSVLFASSARCPLPVAAASASSSTLVLTLRSMRAISEGDCLSISYYPCLVRTAVRQAHLRGLYGFECRCKGCTGRDHSRAFWCCFYEQEHEQKADAADAAAAASDPSPAPRRRCLGVLTPVGLGQRFSDYSCDLCGRAFTSDAQYQQLLAVEQSMRAGGDTQSAEADSSPPIPLRPHPTHYLHALRRPKPAAAPAPPS